MPFHVAIRTTLQAMSSTSVREERKRSRNAMEHDDDDHPIVDDKKTKNDDDVVSTILDGVVACLSGLAHGQKDELHQLIESMGGRYDSRSRLLWCHRGSWL